MLGAMAGSLSRMAFSNDARVACAASGFMKTSVLPHHTMTIRDKLVLHAELFDVVHHLFGKLHLVLAGLHVRPCSRLT